MTDGQKFDHIAKEGYLRTTSGDFVDLVTITLPSDIEGKLMYVTGWVLGNNRAGSLFLKKFSQVGLGHNLLSIPGTEISQTINTIGGVTPDTEVISDGLIVKLRVSSDFSDIDFYGRLEIHGTRKAING